MGQRLRSNPGTQRSRRPQGCGSTNDRPTTTLEALVLATYTAFAGARQDVSVAWKCLAGQDRPYRVQAKAGEGELGSVRIEVDCRLNDAQAHCAMLAALAELEMAELYAQCADVLHACRHLQPYGGGPVDPESLHPLYRLSGRRCERPSEAPDR
jgi:hypothetical protein